MDSANFFVGPAIVVDDRVNDREAGMTAVVEQLRAADMPVVTRTELPPGGEVRHWQGFSLIVLDWELVSAGEEVGVKLPEALQEENADEVAAFVAELLSSFYCPIFILSNQDVDDIRDQLAQRLEVQAAQIDSRVLVKSKASAAYGLLSALEDWVRSHPPVYALRCWEYGYRDAKRQMFTDFEVSSQDWPQVLWGASLADKVDPHFELTETLSRNILHRFEPLVFDKSVLEQAGTAAASGSVVRSVIHRSAVVPASALHDDVVMPGDFFDIPGSDDVFINVTPACDLRADQNGEIEMTVLRGSPVAAKDYGSKTKRNTMRNNPESVSEVVWVLRSELTPYRFDFKSWSTSTWAAHKPNRQGRLLEPYILQLQQRFALHFHRHGLPRLPDGFFED